MASRYPKYVRSHGQLLYYQRDYPTRLWMASQKTWTYPLGVSSTDAASALLTRKISEATSLFELACKRLENSDPNAYSASELDAAAAAFLRRKGLAPGEFIRVPLDPETTREEKQRGRQLQAYPEDYALAAIPEMDDVIDKNHEGGQLTFNDKVVLHAYRKLIDKSKQAPQTLTLLWKEYAKDKGIDPKTRVGKRQQIWWDKFISVAGDAIISPETTGHIHDGLDRYVEERRSLGIKGQSIKREISQPVAALRKASRKYRLGWRIETPDISHDAVDVREVLEHHEQKAVVQYCLSRTKREEAAIAAVALLMIQCGGMASEVGRLETDKIALGAKIPHVVIAGKTKTKDRPRIVPIVIGVEFLQEHLDNGIKWINGYSDSTHSTRLKSLALKATGNPKLTAHCFRHTFRANAFANSADLSAAATIGGWSGRQIGMSGVMLRYGSEGLSKSDGLKALQRESKKIHRHLMRSAEMGVVVPFPKAKA